MNEALLTSHWEAWWLVLLASFKFEEVGGMNEALLTSHWEAWWLVLLASFKFEVSGRYEQGTAHLSVGGLMISTTRQF